MNAKLSGYHKPILFLSIPLLISVIIVSCIGIFSKDVYGQETSLWQIQCKGQDIIDLFLVAPVLFFSALAASRGNKMAITVWAGTILFLVYTFAIYCFDVHFNRLFLLYCISLGLSVYSILYFVFMIVRHDLAPVMRKNSLLKITSVYFIVIGSMFLGLWLSQIMGWMEEGSFPKALRELGLPTNPVHVIDLSILIPGVFITGMMLWRKSSTGITMAPVLLVFFILMNITIATLNYMMYQAVPSTGLEVTWMMGVLSLLSGYLLFGYWRSYKKETMHSHAGQALHFKQSSYT